MNPHHLQFGDVDWSILGEQEGALTKVETPDTNEVVGPTFHKGALRTNTVTGTTASPVLPGRKASRDNQNLRFRKVAKSQWRSFQGKRYN